MLDFFWFFFIKPRLIINFYYNKNKAGEENIKKITNSLPSTNDTST